jgi:hypothetical protein
MTATSDSDRQTSASGEVDSGEDIVGVGAVHDQGRIPINPAAQGQTGTLPVCAGEGTRIHLRLPAFVRASGTLD